MSEIGDLIAAGVPVDRIQRMTDGTYAYAAPCPNERPAPQAETPTEKAERLAVEHCRVLDGPVGMAECGCPSRVDGSPPLLHICRTCGFEGGWQNVHSNCAGCAR